jgi:hypothetical protein
MKRVLLLVLLIVSLVELDWERDRIYLLSSLASLVLVVWSEVVRRRTAEKTITAEVLTTAEGVSHVACTAYTHRAPRQADHFEKVEPGAVLARGTEDGQAVGLSRLDFAVVNEKGEQCT